jgi:tryptophan-rich sensory protein
MKSSPHLLLFFCALSATAGERSPFVVRTAISSIGGTTPRKNDRLVTVRATQPIEASSSVSKILDIRGGGCQDSNPVLFAKIAINAILETGAMVGILVGTQKVAKCTKALPSLAGVSIIQWLGLFVIIFASSLIGSVVGGGLSVATNQILDPNVVPGDPNWYESLRKPSWNPPGWLFPIMWLIVSKPTQMVAVSRILRQSTSVDLSLKFVPALAIYCSHLALGDAWNKVFFGMQCPGRGAAVITAFFAMLLTSAYAFYQVEPSAGLFLLPTCGWVLVATALNWSIYLKNK